VTWFCYVGDFGSPEVPQRSPKVDVGVGLFVNDTTLAAPPVVFFAQR
jgi:hypothetical protein